MVFEKFELIKSYDSEFDVLYFKVTKDFEFKQTIELAPLILMDFDINGFPVSLEIIDASQILNINKHFLENNFMFDMEVTIEKWAIIVNATFKFPIVEKVSFNEVGFNDCEILPKHTHFILA